MVFVIEMKYCSLMHYLFGLEIWKNPKGFFVGQGKYVVSILAKFGMMDYESMDTPMMMNLKKVWTTNFFYPTMYLK